MASALPAFRNVISIVSSAEALQPHKHIIMHIISAHSIFFIRNLRLYPMPCFSVFCEGKLIIF
jgi:hypothetical protein